jgi:hypothetical protein
MRATQIPKEPKMWGKAPEQAAPSHTFDDVMLRYFEDRVAKQRTGFKRAKSTAKPLYLAFTGRAMASITETDIKGYARRRQAAAIAAGTVNKELGMLCAACNHACDELG